MIEKIKDDRFIKKLLIIFLAVQPFLDCYLLYTDSIINIFRFSPTTIIRFLIIGFLVLLVFFNKNNKKSRKWVILYGAFILIYTVLHHLTTYNYDISKFATFKYNFIAEIFYILRMMLPLLVIYITYTLKITKEELIKLVLLVAFISSTIIIGMNLLTISLTSYGGNYKISGNIFSWFSADKPGPRMLASKGWFNSANQISGLFTLLLPLVVYSVFDKFNYKRLTVLIFCLLAMLMIGTRVAALGWLLILGGMLFAYVFFCIIKHLNFDKKAFLSTIIVGGFGGVLFIFSPLVNTNEGFNPNKLDAYLKENKININDMTVEEFLPFSGINNEFYTELYPLNIHKPFWEYVSFDIPDTKRGGNRNVQGLISKDIESNFSNNFSPILGMSYSRFENAKIYLEEDFSVHYYTIGILGIILFLIPYIAIIILKICNMLFIDRKSFNYFSIGLLSSLSLTLVVAYLSGHIVDELIVSFYMAVIAGYILQTIPKNFLNIN